MILKNVLKQVDYEVESSKYHQQISPRLVGRTQLEYSRGNRDHIQVKQLIRRNML